MADEVDLEHDDVDPQVEREAKNLGWKPREQFKGKEEDWVPADEFLEKGKHILPILSENNRKLQRDLLTRDAEIGTLKAQIHNANIAIEKLERHYTEANKRAVDNAKRELRKELIEARNDNDVDKQLELEEKIDQLDKATQDTERQPEKKNDSPPANKPTPEMQAWYQANPWFGSDTKKTKAVSRIAEDLRDEGSPLFGVEFMDECLRIYEEQQQPAQTRQTSKVEGHQISTRGSGGGKTFASLPAAAKQACWDDVDDLVGPDKRYKTQKEWEDKYASIYYSE
jgi:hypothetical protein